MAEHILPIKTYVLVFLILIGFTGLTTGVAFIDLGPFNTIVAVAIAVCKMLFVILFFMHVKYMPGLTKIVVVSGLFWLVIMISLTLADYFTRNWTPSPSGWQTSSISRPPCGKS